MKRKVARLAARTVGLSIVALGMPGSPSSADVWILCELASGAVVVEETVEDGRHQVMDGPFPGPRTAAVWLEENCPGLRCRSPGVCAGAEPERTVAGSWLVVCDPGSGGVGVMKSPPPAGFLLLPGRDGATRQHLERDLARAWAEQNCPSGRCDSRGRCLEEGAASGSPAATDGWVAGGVTSKTLSSPPGSTGSTVSTPRERRQGAGPTGPPAADLSPLVGNTRAAANGCNYPAASASVEQIANFDPEHPFLVANRGRLRSLSRRQRQTERAIWQASSVLANGDLKGARSIAQAAADTAVSCQNQAVAALLDGIDTAIQQTRELKHLKRGQVAARLLPGLVSLSQALSGAQSGVPIDVEALVAETAASFGADLPLNALDPCAFNYEYRSSSSLEPACSCSGYRFDPAQFRCVR